MSSTASVTFGTLNAARDNVVVSAVFPATSGRSPDQVPTTSARVNGDSRIAFAVSRT